MILDKPFLIDSDKELPFVIVVPGGGYNHYGTKEQDSIALHFNKSGFHSAVLHYSIAPTKFPQPLVDLANAVKEVRNNAAEWKVDPSKIILCGFSAGGHLCASLGCWWNSPLLKKYGFNSEEIKPDYLCLCYPVISSDKEICHEGSILRLTENLSAEEEKELCTLTQSKSARDAVSIETHVNADFPPVFMWHTREDQAVHPENTLRMAMALQKNNIEYEYHLFAAGPHGLALAENTQAQCWTELFCNWLKSQLA